MLVYLLALGSPRHPIGPAAWMFWTSTYEKHWGTLYDETYLSFAPLFGHQYSHVWVDFRGIRDAYMREHGLDYFENSRRATYTQRRYAIANPQHWRAYGKNIWGLSASDGPGPASEPYVGRRRPSSLMRRVAWGSLESWTMAPSHPRPQSALCPLRRRSWCRRRSRCTGDSACRSIHPMGFSMRLTRASRYQPRTPEG